MAVILLPVYIAVAWQWVYFSQYICCWPLSRSRNGSDSFYTSRVNTSLLPCHMHSEMMRGTDSLFGWEIQNLRNPCDMQLWPLFPKMHSWHGFRADCWKAFQNAHCWLDPVLTIYMETSFGKICKDCLCGLVVRVPGYRSRGPGSIPGATGFSEKQWVSNGVHSALWVQLRSCLEEKIVDSV
jgi:hypothetical protein